MNPEPLTFPLFASVMHTRGTPVFQDSGGSEDDIDKIDCLAPSPLRLDQVYIRSMYLCSDQLCLSDGCRFTLNALHQIARLVIGQSVLTGHDRTSLPLARFFKAEVIRRGEDQEGDPVHFVRAWFYWLRDTTGARDLLLNIDGGVYREVSLAWRYTEWCCSICRRPNGECGHRMGEIYNGSRCYRLIDCVADVLEGSLVYKGADRNTHLTGVRDYASTANLPPVFLLFNQGDPWLERLREWGVLLESHDFSDAAESFRESVEHLWVRACDEQTVQAAAHHFLAEKSMCLGEIISPDVEEPLAIALLTREDESLVWSPHGGFGGGL